MNARGVILVMLMIAIARTSHAQLAEAGDGTRLSGTIAFTCTPDEKSKAAGATTFDDTLELESDRVTSKVLKGEGFAEAMATPRMVNGRSTFTVDFKKDAATARYFIQVKDDGAVSGSLTRNDGGKALRYRIGATFLRNAIGPAIAIDPDVLWLNGRFVRMLSAHAAIAEAGIKVNKDSVNAMLQSLGTDHNALRSALTNGQMSKAEFARQAEARLVKGSSDLKQLLGTDFDKFEAAYEKPYSAAYVELNQMRAVAMDVASGNSAKTADRAVYQYLIELAMLARQPERRTPAAIAAVKERARADVLKSMGPEQTSRFESALASMRGSTVSQTRPTSAPAVKLPRR